MRLAVTGAQGRVGRAVADLAMNEGHDVVAIDRVPGDDRGAVETIEADLADFDSVAAAVQGCDAMVHLAAIPGPGRDPDHVVHDNNVVSSYHALLAAAQAGIRRIVQASSVNAIGGRFSAVARYDFFPIDETHPTHAEDPYSLSKWICEQQADAIARRFDDMVIGSMRFHGVVTGRAEAAAWLDDPQRPVEKHLWGYLTDTEAARAVLLGLTADFAGHEEFFVVAPDTMMDVPSADLAARYYPGVPVRGDLTGTRGFFDCSKAQRLLGWEHGVDTNGAT